MPEKQPNQIGDIKHFVTEIYERLSELYDVDSWWPAESKDEIIIGAILTQNTNWKNVEKAIANLKSKQLCTLKEIAKADLQELAEAIRPSGYYNTKSSRLIGLAPLLDGWEPNPQKLEKAREFLLTIKGIGEETADSILLYAFELPSFVIDAYTKRLWARIAGDEEKKRYRYYQQIFEENLLKDANLYRDYHSLIVSHAKTYCLKKPRCEKCPLKPMCRYGITIDK
ncbi:MAG: endonuclease III domain-containing protein [Candidatus Cloacimonadia bacterium]|jgi:endonuclease-3 related protein